MTDCVLITGGLGYLGGRIAQHIQNSGRFYLRLGSRQKQRREPSWLSHGCITPMNLSSNSSLDVACHNVKSIIHLAALNHIDCAKYPEQALKVNALGTLKMLQAAERAGVERFVYFSTAHVYGSPLTGMISEKTLPRPVHPYAITHRVAEDYVLAATDNGSLTGIVVRLSNGFGYPIDVNSNCWNLVVNDFCRQAVENKRLILHTSGLQYRDFIPLSDVSAATAYFLQLPKEKCGDGLFNLGGKCSLRVIDLAEKVAERCEIILGYKPEVEIPEAEKESVSDALDYRIDKLLDVGFKLQGSIDEEIDGTLRLCKRSFRG